MEKEEIGRKSVNREAWETGRQESLHPEAEEATGKAETELEAAALQQDRPSLLHHNLNCRAVPKNNNLLIRAAGGGGGGR